MASAYFSGKSWLMDYRALNGRRKQRVPVERVAPVKTAAATQAAKRYAEECEHWCSVLRRAPSPAAVSEALTLGAITQEEADALTGGLPLPERPAPRNSPEALTIIDAGQHHPSSKREGLASAQRHFAHLKQFVAWTQLTYLSDMRIGHAVDWIRHLTNQGMSYDGRRHAMLWVRRAAKMGPTLGIPDPLANFTLDKRPDDEERVEAWTAAEIGLALVLSYPGEEPDADWRPRLAILMCGCLGFRGSEGAASAWKYFNPQLESIRIRRAKTKRSRRVLALPSTGVRWLIAARNAAQASTAALVARAEARPSKPSRLRRPIAPFGPETLMVPSTSAASRGNMLTEASWGKWLGPLMHKLTKRQLESKCLRKTFSTRGGEFGLEPRWIEAYLGRMPLTYTRTTGSSYLAATELKAMKPAAQAIDRMIQHWMWLGRRVLGRRLFPRPPRRQRVASNTDFPTFVLKRLRAVA